MKRIKLPVKLRNDMIDLTAKTIPIINTLTADACPIYIADSFTDTKIIKTFEQLSYWLKVLNLDLEKKVYEYINNELMDFMLLEELNKGMKRGKKNSSD